MTIREELYKIYREELGGKEPIEKIEHHQWKVLRIIYEYKKLRGQNKDDGSGENKSYS